MNPFYKDEHRTLYAGDNRLVLPILPSDFYDSCVTDAPYELGFMGRKWDSSGIAYNVEMWKEVLRVLKPGAHLLAFGGTRTSHRMVCAIEDAGFEIRDEISHWYGQRIDWIYGQGFPKSKDIGRSIDTYLCQELGRHYWKESSLPKGDKAREGDHVCALTPEGDEHRGQHTALKPAHEPICVARKPLAEKTVETNVIRYGTGGLNIDVCRIAGVVAKPGGRIRAKRQFDGSESNSTIEYVEAPDPNPLGRWPANVVFSCFCDTEDETEHEEGCPVRLLDEQSGELKAGGSIKKGNHYARMGYCFADGQSNAREFSSYGDAGGASRFFYVAKASKAEREAGLQERVAINVNDGRKTSIDNAYQRGDTLRLNTHPTVKPTSLIRYLLRLVTPKGGHVLDHFMGSGTHGAACELEGFNFTGIDLEEANCDIAVKRILARCFSLTTSSTTTGANT